MFYIFLFIVIAIVYKIGIKAHEAIFRVMKRKTSEPYLNIDVKESYAKMAEDYTGIHPNTLKKELFDIYKNIQIAWMNFDYKTLRSLCNDDLYNMYKTQLEALKIKGQKNIMEFFVLDNLYFLLPVKTDEKIIISVILKVYQYDYVIDEKNEKIIYGNNVKPMHMTYKLVYEYKRAESNLCPNCNAKINPETSKCEYCNSVIIQGKGRFVLSNKKVIEQK